MMRLTPSKRVNVSDSVLQQLLEAMRNGSLSPGERLPTESELSRLLQVGRSSVREALRVLAVIGLIETRPGRGAYVLRKVEGILPLAGSSFALASHLERVAVQNLFEVRELIEGRAAELAAERATDETLADINRCARQVEREVSSGKTYYDSNTAFHIAIARASQNYVLLESVRQLHGHHRAFRERLMVKETSMRNRDVDEHEAITDAIRSGDGEGARREMIRHIRSSLEVIRRFEIGETVTTIGRLSPRPAPTKARKRNKR
jgi:GntR family transcriptional repressor for pyruvate dehydrogenase complex